MKTNRLLCVWAPLTGLVLATLALLSALLDWPVVVQLALSLLLPVVLFSMDRIATRDRRR